MIEALGQSALACTRRQPVTMKRNAYAVTLTHPFGAFECRLRVGRAA